MDTSVRSSPILVGLCLGAQTSPLTSRASRRIHHEVDMTLFEYLAVAFGLLYSLAALRILGGLPDGMVPHRRYVLHLVQMLSMLVLVATSFWTFWSLRDVEWTFRGFSLALLVPGLLFYCAAALVPENPGTVASWRDHYFAVHRRYFGGLALWGIAAGASATVNLGMEFNHPARIGHAAAVVLGLTGAVSANPRLHAVIATFVVILLARTAWSGFECSRLAGSSVKLARLTISSSFADPGWAGRAGSRRSRIHSSRRISVAGASCRQDNRRSTGRRPSASALPSPLHTVDR